MMPEPTETDAVRLLDATGRPLQKALRDSRCPRCGANADHRVASCGFGTPVPLCGRCGHTFVGEVWRG